MKYLKVFTKFIDVLKTLSDSENGRLFLALLDYAENGTIPTLKGNERYVWPIFKESIDEDIEITEGRKKYGYIGKYHPNWKGGITPKNQKERGSAAYSEWRRSVFERDK